MDLESQATNITMTVLCVDDEVFILKSLKRLLHRLEYQLLLAEDAAQALEIMQQQRVHLIMTDMKMPGMSGAQLLETVATDFPDTYRIMLTGHSDLDTTGDAANTETIHRYLQKPWDNQEIIDAIEGGLNTVRLR